MIDVPDRVKDALRSGDFKKEYKINVYGTDWVYIKSCELNTYGTASDVTISTNGTYKIYVELPNAFTHIAISVNGGVPSLEPAVSENNETYIQYEMVIGSTYTLFVQNRQGSYSELKLALYKALLYTIDNNNLVSESVKFDERMCSDSELKFGLCEGTSVEFQYFDYPSILGKHLNIELDVQYKKADGTLDWYTIPMGQFDVDEISRQASTGIIKAIAYNKLKGTYLDEDCSARITEIIQSSAGGVASLSDILASLLNDYTISTTSYVEVDGGYIYSPVINYTTESGIEIYTIDGFPYEPPSPLDPRRNPMGTYFGIFTLEFYYIPIGESSAQTSDTYYYDINFSGLWNILQNQLNLIWQDSGPSLYNVVSLENIYTVKEDVGEYPSIADSLYAGHITMQNGQLPTMYLRDHKTGTVSSALFTGYYPKFTVTTLVECDLMTSDATTPSTAAMRDKIEQVSNEVLQALRGIQLARIYKYMGSPIDSRNISLNDLKDKITLRELQSASFEVSCLYGKLDRVTDLFAGIELNNAALYPRDNLYPSDSLLPQGTSETGFPSMYSKLWADEGNVRSFRYLIITYKTTETIEGQTREVEKTLQRTVNANGTDDYNMSDNWLFRNLVWTAAQVGTYADAMVTKMQNIRWFPFEMWCAGLPYLESGDEIEIMMSEGTYKSYVLRRTLSGIQNLQDEMINGTLDIF